MGTLNSAVDMPNLCKNPSSCILSSVQVDTPPPPCMHSSRERPAITCKAVARIPSLIVQIQPYNVDAIHHFNIDSPEWTSSNN
jgi:hypothetical protein